MQEVADHLEQLVTETESRYRTWNDEETVRRTSEGQWSRKEVLAHLIDSAANNHQRFIRMQASKFLAMPGYDQDHWVERTQPDARAWADLLTLWLAYNRHLAHIIRRVRPETLDHTMAIGEDPPATLAFLIVDYIDHMRHHLAQIDAA